MPYLVRLMLGKQYCYKVIVEENKEFTFGCAPKDTRPVLKPFKDYAESYKCHKSEKHEMQTYCVDCDIVKIESEIT